MDLTTRGTPRKLQKTNTRDQDLYAIFHELCKLLGKKFDKAPNCWNLDYCKIKFGWVIVEYDKKLQIKFPFLDSRMEKIHIYKAMQTAVIALKLAGVGKSSDTEVPEG